MAETSFVGDRLRTARRVRGYTLEELGNCVGVSRQFIQQVEQDKRTPSDELRSALSVIVGVSPAFFSRPPLTYVHEGNCSFRARRTTLLSVKERVKALANLLIEALSVIETFVDFPEVAFSCERPASMGDVERIARTTRVELGLALTAPIANVTRVIESAGVVLSNFGDVSDKVDALSVPAHRPVIVHNTAKQSPSRARFDLAHELGHLVMHQGVETNAIEEAQADRFAGAFLFPSVALTHEYPRERLKWSSLFALKARWGVSVAAIVRRASDVGIIDAAEYRSANVHLRRRGWHRGEPNELAVENPESLSLAFEELTRAGTTAYSIADRLGLSIPTLESVTGLSLLPDPREKIVHLMPVTTQN